VEHRSGSKGPTQKADRSEVTFSRVGLSNSIPMIAAGQRAAKPYQQTRLPGPSDRRDGARDGHLRVHESGGGGVRAYGSSAAKFRESVRVGERKRIVTRWTIERAGR
jgi:hypothetical protein